MGLRRYGKVVLTRVAQCGMRVASRGAARHCGKPELHTTLVHVQGSHMGLSVR
jgi:hypothetical protein